MKSEVVIILLLSTLATTSMAEWRFAGYGFDNYECSGGGTALGAFDGQVSSGLDGVVAVETTNRGSMYADATCDGQGYVANADECSYIDQSSSIGCMKVYFDD